MAYSSQTSTRRQTIAVIGSGIAGMSAAWLLSQRHDVTVFDKEARLGGHANTVTIETSLGRTPVDTGFIVFNDATYPNLVALFDHLGVETQVSDMSFGVSLEGGNFEYSSASISALMCGGRNLFSPRFLSMMGDLIRFYRTAGRDIAMAGDTSLGAFLDRHNYSAAFQRDHILPQAAAIWSASIEDIRDYPVSAFVRFFENHGLLKLSGRPLWRTVSGGSRSYVERLTAPIAARAQLGVGVASIRREGGGVWIKDARGAVERFDSVVIAAHADQALALLDDADPRERRLLSAFRYSRNRAVLHTDRALMPRRRPLWASWNYVGSPQDDRCVVTYWMNKLQNIKSREQLFLTLNPRREPEPEAVLYETEYQHPLFDAGAMKAQRELWSLQGARNTWFCGAHFGAGFHEDGLQAGLAVAEQLGGVRRPWRVDGESERIFVAAPSPEIGLAA